jgi:lipoprotein-anchoring transpeptidase ErfK/SrfK
MSHGCINMRTEDAKWLFRWALPEHKIGNYTNRGYGTPVQIHY